MNFMERISCILGKQNLFKQNDGKYYNGYIEKYQTKEDAQQWIIDTFTICEEKGYDNLKHKTPFTFNYNNWKNETSIRKVIPIETVYEINEFHGDEPLWLLKAYDIDKDDVRYFDMSKINI